ncbi:MAG: ParB/RepB/Spo0J family partition protein [Boseongicola sp. SB0677_bin_26]|nr:ParB/RepB/Spo0J family partition protein [Boseongicola sp. SB0665_bin_10]MYG28724.1 ParB/RepB/Spo0J family partition protein [Boseongicola sp. SB0677_bin_26]
MENTDTQEREVGRPRMARGLSSLMADLEAKPASATGAPRAGESAIGIDRISPGTGQPRRTFADSALDELAASIREKGIIQPLILRKSPRDPDRYEIVAGERRWRAAQRAQLHEVPAIVRDLDDAEVLEIAIVENIQRADLNAMEEAGGYQQLMERFGHTQEALAQALGKSRSHVANLLRLLALPKVVQEMVRSGDLSAGHGRALVTAPDPETLARLIVAKGLSVRQAEALAQDDRAGGRPQPRRGRRRENDADTRAAERDLAAALGMKVSIARAADGEAGTVTFRYGSLGQFDELCRRVLVTTGTG